ncbi:carbohydrate ABC transporter permease [Actibacterium pelagium]|uniref:ABC transporter permease n=1 Tax=Actibacterium pelagium TaxID=2029103 RepID=A0A917EP84_9RHOB|nr:sugar ABC transporter permease [Actibacterium pelagium]GGE61751.1 ABC transporter permease [Actibacterium pelagium]
MSTKSRDKRQQMLMLAPALIFLGLLIVVPFFMSIGLSFTDQRLVPRPIPTRFVGFTNYERLFDDPLFWKAVGNTALFAALVVPFQLFISLSVALVLNTALPFRGMFRAISVFPLLLPMSVVVAIWAVIYRIPTGPLNAIYQFFAGSEAYIDFIGSSSTAMVSLVVLSAWATFPYQMLIYLAGLQDIPGDQYEAAQLDGANAWQRFLYVTWPGLRNVNIFLLIITTIQALKLFTQVSIMTKGGPNGATTTIIYYLFQQGYTTQKVGYASAVAVIFFLAVVSIALLQRIILKNEGET